MIDENLMYNDEYVEMNTDLDWWSKLIGNYIIPRVPCPKCGASLLRNGHGKVWCSGEDCFYGCEDCRHLVTPDYDT